MRAATVEYLVRREPEDRNAVGTQLLDQRQGACDIDLARSDGIAGAVEQTGHGSKDAGGNRAGWRLPTVKRAGEVEQGAFGTDAFGTARCCGN